MKKKVYFISDIHLGADVGNDTSREREKRVCRWLNKVKEDASQIYIVGDLFDFWFEYKTVVPKGYIRILGKLAELRDSGIPIDFFIGNHDMWMFSYLDKELGIPIHRKGIIREHFGKHFFIHHGDGKGPRDTKYKLLKMVFANPLCQWLFERLHPNFGIWLANAWSGSSREKHNLEEEEFQGKDKEWLVAYVEKKVKELDPPIDFFIFGHRHLAIDYTMSNGQSRYINLGEWMHMNSYGVFDGEKMEILFFENEDGKIANK